MARRRRTNSFFCGEDGCSESVRYQRSNRRDDERQWARYGGGKWRCTRHTDPGSVLSEDNVHRTKVLVSSRVLHNGKSLGLFWKPEGQPSASGFGFTYGPGWKAWADDFPEGTKIVVTARVVLPRRETTDAKARVQSRRDAEEGL